jgi:hypothetical protein
VTSTVLGFSGNAGIEYVVHNFLAIQFNASYHSVPNSSSVYFDSRLAWMQLNAGLVLRLGMQHKYLY